MAREHWFLKACLQSTLCFRGQIIDTRDGDDAEAGVTESGAQICYTPREEIRPDGVQGLDEQALYTGHQGWEDKSRDLEAGSGKVLSPLENTCI